MEVAAVRCHLAMLNRTFVCSGCAMADTQVPLEWTLSFLTDVARGLAYAHDNNIVHLESVAPGLLNASCLRMHACSSPNTVTSAPPSC